MSNQELIWDAVGEECRFEYIDRRKDYVITDTGKCVSLKRSTPHVLRPWIHTDGYERVTLYLESGKRKEYIHRLVAMAFVPRFYGDVVNHMDGDKRNNAPSNLEWVTAEENIRHAHRTGLRNPTHKYMEDKYGV